MIIYGASGHGKVVCDILTSNNQDEVIVFLDDNKKSETFYNRSIYLPEEINLKGHKMLIAIGNNKTRNRISKQFENFHTAIHKNSAISPSALIGEGTVIMPYATCNADSIVGKHVILNTGCIVEHDCTIGDYVHISPKASLAGNVQVGEGTHIGIGANVIQGIRIGSYATIGAGSVVIKDVPNGATVVGVPAKIIKT